MLFLERILRFWIISTNNIAVALYYKGEYKKAIDNLLSAISVRTKVFSYYLSYFHFLVLEANLSACLMKDDRFEESSKIWNNFKEGI